MTKKKGEKAVNSDARLDELYKVLLENDYPKVLSLGQQMLAGASDKLAVVEAMLDAIENLFHGGEVSDQQPMRELERQLRAEKKRLRDAGATSDVYARFLDPPQEE